MLKTPVLFLIFNRIDTSQKVFDAIKKQKPKYLYVAADGPREHVAGEKEKCLKTRQIVEQIDWDCELKTLFRDRNLGCGRAVSEAISWFFEHVEEGIILEDDCLPHSDFFPYCEELLERFRDNKHIKTISGSSFPEPIENPDYSYFFSRYPIIWGWASWRRTWADYKFDANQISKKAFKKKLKTLFKKDEVRYWMQRLWIMRKKKLDTWDFQLTFSSFLNDGLSVIPTVNLISNIGFAADALHTSNSNSTLSERPTDSILPLKHNINYVTSKELDRKNFKNNLKKNIFKLLGCYLYYLKK